MGCATEYAAQRAVKRRRVLTIVRRTSGACHGVRSVRHRIT